MSSEKTTDATEEEIMNMAEVERRIALIKQYAGDDEVAHCHEDSLYFDLLQAIAHGTCDDPVACAKLAITVADIEFARRTA